MRGFTREELERDRPLLDISDTVAHALDALFKDQSFSAGDFVVQDLTFEELIGVLLQARDLVQETRNGSQRQISPGSASK